MVVLPMAPSRALWCVLLNTWKRFRCQHVPADEDDGYSRCGLCGTWMPL